VLRKQLITTYVDTTNDDEMSCVTDALVNFFYGCNVPLHAPESKHFKEFNKKIRPSYERKIPSTKTVVSMIHGADGSQTFLNAYDVTRSSETGEKLPEIVRSSIEIAKETYKTSIFAVVIDNASTMIRMGCLMKHLVWHSTCHSHIIRQIF
jgi:hypothetical protein